MVQNVLIVGPSWVGDMVMAQTLFKLLKQQDPAMTIDVLAPTWTLSLLNRMPEIARAIELPFVHGELNFRKRYQLAMKLRSVNYDQAIVLPNSFKSALIPWLANIPKRTGWLGEYRYFLLNDIRRLDKKRYPLMIDQFMALALPPNASLPTNPSYPSFHLAKVSQDAVRAKYQITMKVYPVLALAPGAEYGPAKRWPEEYYAEIATNRLNAGWQIWLFGSQKDVLINEKIMSLTQHRCENFTGRTNLAETIDLLSLVDGLVSNDSGLMHIAAALQKPIIAIYGSTSPAFTPPLSKNATILKLELDCQPCFERVCPLQHYRCLRDLTPDRVLTAISAWRHNNNLFTL